MEKCNFSIHYCHQHTGSKNSLREASKLNRRINKNSVTVVRLQKIPAANQKQCSFVLVIIIVPRKVIRTPCNAYLHPVYRAGALNKTLVKTIRGELLWWSYQCQFDIPVNSSRESRSTGWWKLRYKIVELQRDVVVAVMSVLKTFRRPLYRIELLIFTRW